MNTEQLQQCLDHLEDAAFGYVGGVPHGVVESARKSAEKLRAEFAGKVLVPVDTADKVGAALRMAFIMGQTYWQQADSEHTSQHRKAGETMEKYNQLRSETVAMLTASQEPKK